MDIGNLVRCSWCGEIYSVYDFCCACGQQDCEPLEELIERWR